MSSLITIPINPLTYSGWLSQQLGDIAAPSVIDGTVETREIVDGEATTYDWDVDSLVAKNIVEASITHEFDYSRATLPLEIVSVKAENATYDEEYAADYDFTIPTVKAKVGNPGTINLRLGYRYDDGHVETVPVTLQMLTDSQVDENDLFVTFSGTSFASVLDNTTFYGGRYVSGGIPADDLLAEILAAAEFPMRGWWNYTLGADTCVASTTLPMWASAGYAYYEIDPTLADTSVVIPVPPVTLREALTMVAAYADAYIYHRSDGSLYVGRTLPVATEGYTLGETQVYDRPVSSNGKRIQRISTNLQTYVVGSDSQSMLDTDIALPNTTQQTVTVTHDACASGTLAITSGGTLSGTPAYNTYSTTFTVDPTDTTIHITLTALPVSINQQPFSVSYNESGDAITFDCPIASDPTLTTAMLDTHYAVESADSFTFKMRDDASLAVGMAVGLQMMSQRAYSTWNYILGDAACVASTTLALQTTNWDNTVPVIIEKIVRAFDGSCDADVTAITNINP